MNESKSFRLNKTDLKKIAKGLGLAMGGAGVAYILGILDYIDIDAYTPVFVAIASSALNALQIWIRGQN
mgnify:FL=1